MLISDTQRLPGELDELVPLVGHVNLKVPHNLGVIFFVLIVADGISEQLLGYHQGDLLPSRARQSQGHTA